MHFAVIAIFTLTLPIPICFLLDMAQNAGLNAGWLGWLKSPKFSWTDHWLWIGVIWSERRVRLVRLRLKRSKRQRRLRLAPSPRQPQGDNQLEREPPMDVSQYMLEQGLGEGSIELIGVEELNPGELG